MCRAARWPPPPEGFGQRRPLPVQQTGRCQVTCCSLQGEVHTAAVYRFITHILSSFPYRGSQRLDTTHVQMLIFSDLMRLLNCCNSHDADSDSIPRTHDSVDPVDGTVFVADGYGNSRVLAFSPDGTLRQCRPCQLLPPPPTHVEAPEFTGGTGWCSR